MKKSGLVLLFILLCSVMYAQQIRVLSFKTLISDHAQLDPYLCPKDCNGALIIIPIKGGDPNNYTFEVSTKIIQLRIVESTVFLVIPNKTKTITIKHRNYGVIKKYKFTEKIKERHVYQLELETAKEFTDEKDVAVFRCDVEPKFENYDNGRISYIAFHHWVRKRTISPMITAGTSIGGDVHIQFIIGKDGYIRDCKVLSSPHWQLSNEVERVLLSSPRWRPGLIDGKPINMYSRIKVNIFH